MSQVGLKKQRVQTPPDYKTHVLVAPSPVQSRGSSAERLDGSDVPLAGKAGNHSWAPYSRKLFILF